MHKISLSICFPASDAIFKMTEAIDNCDGTTLLYSRIRMWRTHRIYVDKLGMELSLKAGK